MTWNHRDITDWLLRDGPSYSELATLCDALGEKLHELGAPVFRIRMAIRTVHPLLAAISVAWERGAESKEMQSSPHGLTQTPVYSGSPMATVSHTLSSLRRDLTTVTPDDHSACQEHHASDATDYYGLP